MKAGTINTSNISLRGQDQEDDYQDIDEKSIAEPNYLGRQQVYVSLDKEEAEAGLNKSAHKKASFGGDKTDANQYKKKPDS